MPLKSALKKRISEKLEKMIRDGAGCGFQLALGWKDQSLGCFCAGVGDLKDKRRVHENTWFDLASLTKILVTADGMMRALQRHQITDLEAPLKNYFPFFASDLKNQSLRSLLEHRSGLPAIFDDVTSAASREDRIRFFLKKIDDDYGAADQEASVYSDVGFMVLGVLLEHVNGQRLRRLVEGRENLAYGRLYFRGEFLSSFFQTRTVAAIQSLDSRTKKWLTGEVQDPRAQWWEGDAGHAGLFGTAMGVEEWGRELYLGYQGKSRSLSDRVLRAWFDFSRSTPYLGGFDRPARSGHSQVGQFFSRDTTVGHLGYSGSSVWMDLERGFRVTLLSHRFQPGLDPDRLKVLRPAFHDWLWTEVFNKLSS